MRITLDDPSLVPNLLEFLRAFPDVAASPRSLTELDVALLSTVEFEARRDEIAQRLATWLKAHPHTRATLVPAPR
jgi:hypothetical protein